MNDEQRDAIREANRRRRSIYCRKCGGAAVRERDGSEVGGMPGIKYRECGNCGYCQPITKRPRREKLKENK